MPCNCDHLEPSEFELEGSRVQTLLDELDGKGFDKTNWDGYHPKVYDKSVVHVKLNEWTRDLCSRLQKRTDIHLFSLEMQMWWRDHQKADKERVQKEGMERENKRLRKQALAKLTPDERKALGQ